MSSTRRPVVLRVRRGAYTEHQKWESAYRKALKQYGHKSQAERIAWAAIGVIPRRRFR